MQLFQKLTRSIYKRLAARRPFPAMTEWRGATLLLDPANWIDNRLIAGIPFETAQIDHALALAARERIDTVIDIGANFGLYSVLLGRLEGVRDVVAFEPVAVNHAQLMGNAFANRLTDRLTAHRLGCGAEATRATIHIDPRSTGVSRLDIGTTHRDAGAFRRTEEVDIVRADDFLPFEDRRAFVKIDVEGAAASVIAGMPRFLAANRCWLQVEMIGAEREATLAALAAAGYTCERVIENDGIFSLA
jgi:FkbM family methyltransferase